MTADDQAGPSTPPNPTACPTSVATLNPADTIFRVALNAGDTSGSDAGLKAGFDNVLVRTRNSDITYDFDPAAVTPPAPTKACAQNGLVPVNGTTRNDVRTGTDVAEKIDLMAGNDSSDAKGGADCVLGGDGNDQLKGGDGNDEIQAGAGNDTIDAGAGADVVDAGTGNDYLNVRDKTVDTVDCGTGNDLVLADPDDAVGASCERRV